MPFDLPALDCGNVRTKHPYVADQQEQDCKEGQRICHDKDEKED